MCHFWQPWVPEEAVENVIQALQAHNKKQNAMDDDYYDQVWQDFAFSQ